MAMKLIACIVSLLFSFSLAPQCINAQTKRALVIGLGMYKDSAWNKINGDKDVPYVLEILNNANYEQIITCVNDEATKAGIISAFRTLTEACKPNDIVYIHYSGHGQQMKDMSCDESDAFDECWIPYDAYRRPCKEDRGEKHLVDDEVNILLNNVRNKIGDGGKMLVVMDACHSGDATRGTDEVARGVDDIFMAVKSLLDLYINGDNADIHPCAERWIALSACACDQVNFEMKDPVAGKLTYAIYTELKNGVAGDNEAFFRRLRMFINRNTGTRPQKPIITGEINRYNITDILR